MGAVEQFDAETERDIVEFVPVGSAEEYRARRRKTVARSLAQLADASSAAGDGIAARMTDLTRRINESIERNRKAAK